MSFSYGEGFFAEGSTDGDERWNSEGNQPHKLGPERVWYRKHFYNKPHKNYVSDNSALGSVCISVLREEEAAKVIVRTAQDTKTYEVNQTTVKNSIWRKLTGKTASCRAIIGHCRTELRNANLRLVNSSQICDLLLQLEEPKFDKKYKIGLLYSTNDQSHENEMFGNVEQETSPQYQAFVEFIGEEVELKGFSNFDGGLDTQNNMSGKTSVYTKWRDTEIMWHVSTKMPYFSADPQQLERKKHIGNDRAVLVFRDGDNPIPPNVVASKQLHIIGVVSPHVNPDDEDNRYFQFSIAAKNTVPEFGEEMPHPPIFKEGTEFRDFLLQKVTDGVNATRFAADFQPLMMLLYQSKLKELVTRFSTSDSEQ